MKRLPKILIDLRAKPHTGIHRYASRLLEQKKFSCEPYQDSFTDYAKEQRISPFSAFCRFLYECFFLPFLLRKKEIRLFHCTKNFGLPLFAWGTKRILTVQDIIPLRRTEYAPGLFYRIYYYCNILLSCLAADRIICISQFTADELMHVFPFVRRKLAITYLGVDFEYFNAPATTGTMSSEFDLTTPYILTIGGTEPRKNTQILLDLFLKHDFNGCKLIVVGGEWNGKKFAREYQECQRIHLPGKVSEDQLLTLYKHAAVFVFPSLYEGFGLPPLEAMASGVPVIAAKASCLPEILGDAAVWFDPGKPEELLSAIHQILQNDTFRQEQVQKGYKKAKSYSWEKTVAETLGIYQSVLNGD